MTTATPAEELAAKGSALPAPESIDEGLCSDCGGVILGRGLMASFCLSCIAQRRRSQARFYRASLKGVATRARWNRAHPGARKCKDMDRRREYERLWKQQWRARRKAA